MRAAHDELLRPVLTESDDAIGLRRPFRPPSLVLATFFGGAFCAALLFAWNWRELGRPREARLSGGLFALLGVLLPLALMALVSRGMLGWEPDDRRLLRFVVRAITVVPALLVARAQQRRYRLFEAGGGEPRAALGPALGAILLGFFANTALVLAGAALMDIEGE